jgi:rhodanese-related sulfurtransferase
MIREITRQQIEFKIAQGDKLLLAETQAGEAYEKGHLPNAVPMPPGQAVRLAPEYFPNTGVEIVIYGENENSPEVDQVAQELASLGYGNLYLYRAGKRDWFESGEY